MNDRTTHWLRSNAANRIPRRVICFDCEAQKDKSVKGEVHSFRLASLTFDRLDAEGNETHETERLDFGTPEALWGYVADFASHKMRTCAFAHNLSYDIRLANGLGILPDYGFECVGIALTNYSFWARFKRGNSSLYLQDSLSFVPANLAKVASAGQLPYVGYPGDDGTDEQFLERCRNDVEVTRNAVLRVLRFIKSDDLGDFRLTGAAQATAAFRHRFMREKSLLVHDNEEALTAERDASYTGRTEVLRHGSISETVYEYDYEYAYTRLAADIEVPTKLIARHSPLPVARFERMMEKYAVLATVTVTTNVPVVPCRNGNRIIWPVGEFEATLWDHELRLLSANNATYRVGQFWFYQREPLLKAWAEWMMEKLNAPAEDVDPIVRLMLKDWSRALIGRFGLRYSVLDHIATLEDSDVARRGVWDADESKELAYLQLGHKLFETTDRVESPNSTPMVMSAIMSAARVRLWKAIETAGWDHVYYVDTDGLICDKRGARRLASAIASGKLPGLRRKAAYSGADFRAPRNIDLGEIRRVSGAPRTAERLAPSIYRGEVWESLPTALKQRHIGRVFVHERTFRVSDADPRRIHLPDGTTAPHRLTLDGVESATVAA